MITSYLSGLGLIIPEILMVVTMLFALLLESTYSKSKKNSPRNYVFISVIIGFLSAMGILVSKMDGTNSFIFTSSLVIDQFSNLTKLILLFSGLGITYLTWISSEVEEGVKSEFLALFSGIIFSGMIIASSNNFLVFYLGVEILSIFSYILVSLKRNSSLSIEAGLKYVIYGGLASGIMIFGISHLYGIFGNLNFHTLVTLIPNLKPTELGFVFLSFAIIMVGIGFKVGLVPFHMWVPDIYEGAPIPVTAFLTIVPKVAVFSALLRLAFVFFSTSSILNTYWVIFCSLLAASSMIVGNVSAINQKSVKRMLAYSSIAHAGFMVMTALVLDDLGIKSLLIYGISYLFMTLVPFIIITKIYQHYGNDHFERFNGLIYKYPLVSIMLCISLFSLSGLPPFVGFVAKFNVLSAVVAKKYYGIALIAALTSVVGVFYYLRLVRLMIFKKSESNDDIAGFGFLGQLIIVIFSLPVLLLGIFWENLYSLVNFSSFLLLK